MRTQSQRRPTPAPAAVRHPPPRAGPLTLTLGFDTALHSYKPQNNSPVTHCNSCLSLTPCEGPPLTSLSTEPPPLLQTHPDGHLSITAWFHRSNFSLASRPCAPTACPARRWITSTLRITSFLQPRKGAGAVVPVWPRGEQRLQGLT